jgi:hypothetical protein
MANYKMTLKMLNADSEMKDTGSQDGLNRRDLNLLLRNYKGILSGLYGTEVLQTFSKNDKGEGADFLIVAEGEVIKVGSAEIVKVKEE